MPIAIHGDGETTRFVEEPFRDEQELHACLERSPYLLVAESEPPVAAVQKEVALPSSGALDLLVVDKTGLPIAVEVKLARNAQSRREVVAQAFDYVADLSRLTFDELDDLVDGALGGALQELSGPDGITSLRKQCATNLRAGRIRLVIAVDSASEDLIRIVTYIRDHSDIDVRLVTVSKFDQGRILVPRILVSGASDTVGGLTPGTTAASIDPVFAAAIEEYDGTADDLWKTRGHGRTIRQIYPDDWPGSLHYEFKLYADEIGVELHLEHERVRRLQGFLAGLSGRELTRGISLVWNPGWYGGLGRLVAKVPKELGPEVVAGAMKALVALTRETIESNLE